MDNVKFITLGEAVRASGGRFYDVLYKAIDNSIKSMSDEDLKNAFCRNQKTIHNSQSKDLEEFLTRSAIYANRVIRDLKADIIVTPISSSDLNKDFVNDLSKRNNINYYVDSFTKSQDIGNIKIDIDNPKMTDKIKNNLVKILDRGKKQGYLSLKMFLPQHRKFILNLFEIVDSDLTHKFEDKNVIIVDDIMTTGTTAVNIYRLLKSYGANEVNVLTLFKSL